VLTLDVLSEAGGQAQWLASGSEDSTVRVWDVAAGE
jgi:WD40 repeat protein